MKLLIILGALFDFSLFFFWIWFLKCNKDVLNEDIKVATLDFPGGAVVKNLPANAGDTGSSPGPGRSHMLWSK